VRRALIAAPSSKAFTKGAPYLKSAVDAAVAGNGAKAAKGVSDFWNKGLVTVVDEFGTKKEAR
jgi:hypothetical protein